jgi:Ca-activated chloride channel family protein
MGNLKDDRLEQLADEGDGNYGYIDSLTEARKTLLEEMTGTLVTIAKDVKIQVEFNPARVAGYRLIGYENRLLAAEEFNDDTKDAGEIGAGHTVTALYELVPAGQEIPGVDVDDLRYQATTPTEASFENELFLVKVRYKAPKADESTLLTFPVRDSFDTMEGTTADFQFASSVAAFGMLLRKSPFVENLKYDDVIAMANASRDVDEFGYRAEFVNLVRNAAAITDAHKS